MFGGCRWGDLDEWFPPARRSAAAWRWRRRRRGAALAATRTLAPGDRGAVVFGPFGALGIARGTGVMIRFFPGSIAKGSSSKSGCQLHLPTSHANLSRVTSPANFSCQLVESYFTCQLLMPTCRELLHLLTSHANLSRVTSPAYFSCQLFGCYLILLKAQANLSGVTSLS